MWKDGKSDVIMHKKIEDFVISTFSGGNLFRFCPQECGWKNVIKPTYTQSYSHYPQKSM